MTAKISTPSSTNRRQARRTDRVSSGLLDKMVIQDHITETLIRAVTFLEFDLCI